MKKFDECPIEWMQCDGDRWTLCEYLRDLYRQIDTGKIDRKDCLSKLRISTTIAKTVLKRLAEYEPKWIDIGNMYDRKEKS